MNSKVIYGISLGVISAINQLYLRPYAYKHGWSSFIQTILGCLPNFCAALGFGLIAMGLVKDPEKARSYVVGTGIGVFAREIFTNNPEGGGFGNSFDYADLVATVLGTAVALWLSKNDKKDTTN